MVTMRCRKCGYKWETKSTHVYVSCPSCLSKVRRVEVATPIISGTSPDYEKYVEEMKNDPTYDEETDKPDATLSYVDWCLAINPK